jgi:hypothetical protein
MTSISFIAKDGHNYNLIVKRNAKTVCTCLYNAFPIQIDVNVEEVLSSLLSKSLRKSKKVGRGL